MSEEIKTNSFDFNDPATKQAIESMVVTGAEFIDSIKNEICANLEIQAKATLATAFIQPNAEKTGFVFDGETFGRAWEYITKDYQEAD
jgi:hypothetical protein